MPVAGDTVLITGAGSGIGRALALEASKRGMKLALVGRRREALEETRRQLPSTSECLIIPGDVTVPDDRQLIRRSVVEAWGRLTLLINNAGVVTAGRLSSLRDDDLDRLMATNLSAPIALTRDLLPLLCAGAPARVVNVGSLVGDIAMPLFCAYSASKFGLRGFSNGLRRELKPLRIGVTYAAPRGAETPAASAAAQFLEPFGMRLDSTASIAVGLWRAIDRGADNQYPRTRERLFVLVERLWPSLITGTLTRQLQRGGGYLIDTETNELVSPTESISSVPQK